MTIFLTEADAARLGIDGAKKRTKRHAPGAAVARVARGEGDRVPDLMKLAAAGWVRTNCMGGEHWMTHRDGRTTTRQPTYRQMLDEGLKLCTTTT